MTASPEALARDFLRSWAEPRADRIASFFADDATWLDGPQGVRHGRQAITAELMRQLRAVQPMRVEVITLVAAGPRVMVEWQGHGTIAGRSILTEVMAAFEIDTEGLIRRFSERYDLAALVNQLTEA